MGPYGPALYSNGVLLAFHTTFYFYDVIYFLASSRACVQVRSTTRARAQVGHGDGCPLFYATNLVRQPLTHLLYISSAKAWLSRVKLHRSPRVRTNIALKDKGEHLP